MSYESTINYLYGLQKYGIKLGLDNIKKLLARLGNPQNHFLSIHIAGTNGKGSTSAITASILQAAGLKTGLFTSPHLVSFTERVRVDYEQIAEAEVVEMTEEIRSAVQSLNSESHFAVNPPAHAVTKGDWRKFSLEFNPTFFEIVTAMGFLYFKRKNIDCAVIETGMGGRLDATNVLNPVVSVITNISYDHKEFLGDSISQIAGEKAGIVKDRVPVVSAMQEKDAEDMIKAKAKENAAPLFTYGNDFHGVLKSSDINGITFDYHDSELQRPNSVLTDLFLPLAGEHQLLNACLAIKSALTALKSAEVQKHRSAEGIKPGTFELPSFSPQASRRGGRTSFLREGLANARWPGRLDLISHNPPILIDGAHNPAAAAILADSLKNIFLRRFDRIILLLGIMSDKDIRGIISPLLPLSAEVILIKPAYERAASPEVLAGYTQSLGFSYRIAGSVADGMDMAHKMSKEKDLIVITGSFYTIGEAKEALGEKGILSRLRE